MEVSMYAKEEKFLQQVVKQAYKHIIQKHTFEVSAKGEKDLVTTLDLATETFIIEQLKKHFPNDYIVSEEFHSTSQLQGRCWVIDPIDGTLSFANNIRDWCIQMAFVHNGAVQASVIFIPTSKELYFASNQGAFCNGKPIHVQSNVEPENALFYMGNVNVKYKNMNTCACMFQQKLSEQIMRTRNLGSAGCEFALVAHGKAHGYILFADNMWDYLPGMFLCEKAGGVSLHTTMLHNPIHISLANQKLANLVQKLITESEKIYKNNKK